MLNRIVLQVACLDNNIIGGMATTAFDMSLVIDAHRAWR